ncbi:hypothetical protein [Nocardia aurea]|uniref:hypothetical protein n=1 Tax=Nocardia aurea TaxID=2144174 RepID=UPI0013007223|nr:hypothetical protein [Nocardia aurea]
MVSINPALDIARPLSDAGAVAHLWSRRSDARDAYIDVIGNIIIQMIKGSPWVASVKELP